MSKYLKNARTKIQNRDDKSNSGVSQIAMLKSKVEDVYRRKFI